LKINGRCFGVKFLLATKPAVAVAVSRATEPPTQLLRRKKVRLYLLGDLLFKKKETH